MLAAIVTLWVLLVVVNCLHCYRVYIVVLELGFGGKLPCSREIRGATSESSIFTISVVIVSLVLSYLCPLFIVFFLLRGIS